MRVALAVLFLSYAVGGGTLLLKNVRIVDVEKGTAISSWILIEGGRIKRIGSGDSSHPEATQTIELANRYVVPGLCDMHVHVESALDMETLALFGIATARDMAGWDVPRRLAASVRDGKVLGPTLIRAGPALGGQLAHLIDSGTLFIGKKANIPEIIERAKRDGVDGVKVHEGLSMATYDRILAESRRVGLPVWGHVPNAVGLRHCIMAGQRSFEHLGGWFRFLTKDDPGSLWPSKADFSRLPAMARLAAKKRAFHVPTLVALRTHTKEGRQRALGDPFVGRFARSRWLHARRVAFSWSFPSEEQGQARMDIARSVLVKLVAEGVPIVCGTDAGALFVSQGASLHDELELMADAGLSNLEILRAATCGASDLVGDRSFGRIEIGARADFVVTDKDPIADIRVLRSPFAVILRGRILGELDGRRRDLRRRIATGSLFDGRAVDQECLRAILYDVWLGEYLLGESRLCIGPKHVSLERIDVNPWRRMSRETVELSREGRVTAIAFEFENRRGRANRSVHLRKGHVVGSKGVGITPSARSSKVLRSYPLTSAVLWARQWRGEVGDHLVGGAYASPGGVMVPSDARKSAGGIAVRRFTARVSSRPVKNPVNPKAAWRIHTKLTAYDECNMEDGVAEIDVLYGKHEWPVLLRISWHEGPTLEFRLVLQR